MTIKPTNEQHRAVELFNTGATLKINAFAGTGKTATLILLAHATSDSGMYLAFNRALAKEARSKFPCRVQCKTTHSLACNSIPDCYRKNKDKMFGAMNSNRAARVLNLKPLECSEEMTLTARQLASLTLGTLRQYQQIYEWRGAVNAMERVHTDSESALTQSFRFGQPIADAASRILDVLGERKRITGNPAVASQLGCSRPDVILCRTNAGVIDCTIRALNAGERVHVVGGSGEILRLLNCAARLKAGIKVDHPELFGFDDWSEVVEYALSDEGAGLRTFVTLVEDYGEQFLIDSLTRMNASEHDATLILSTVHKAKGRQWNHVQVLNDFSITSKSRNGKTTYNPAEVRLLYVALTRARLTVQLPQTLADKFGIDQTPNELPPG